MIIHTAYKVAISIVLVAIILSCSYYLFKIVPTGSEVLDYVNWHKAILYGTAVVVSTIGLLIINCRMK